MKQKLIPKIFIFLAAMANQPTLSAWNFENKKYLPFDWWIWKANFLFHFVWKNSVYLDCKNMFSISQCSLNPCTAQFYQRIIKYRTQTKKSTWDQICFLAIIFNIWNLLYRFLLILIPCFKLLLLNKITNSMFIFIYIGMIC